MPDCCGFARELGSQAVLHEAPIITRQARPLLAGERKEASTDGDQRSLVDSDRRPVSLYG